MRNPIRLIPLYILLLVAAWPLAVLPQQPATEAPLRNQALNVYIVGTERDFNYIRQEITFVNYVNDQSDADVFILVTQRSTGSGGREVTLNFTGQRAFAGMMDTLSVFHQQNDTEIVTRERVVTGLKVGLMRYVAKTPLLEQMSITYGVPSGFDRRVEPEVVDDPWDSWVFRINTSGSFSGEELQNSSSLSGSFSANRVTEDWIIRSSYSHSDSRSVIKRIVRDWETGEPIDTTSRTTERITKTANAGIIRSLGPHAGIGISARYNESTYSNIDGSIRIAPAFEYNLFPYSESTTRELLARFSLGFESIDYVDTTVYDKISENLLSSSLDISYDLSQRWGSLRASFEYSTYLHDFDLNSVALDAFISLRLGGGFSFNINGEISRINDDLNIVKENLEEWEVLLSTTQRSTDYRYDFSVGISYTFGSIYSNVVNTRLQGFGGSGGSGGGGYSGGYPGGGGGDRGGDYH